MWVLTLLAQAEGAEKDPFRRPEVIWGTIGLAVALLAGAVVVWAVDRWRKRATQQTSDSGTELTDYRAMYDRGEITEAEYVKLRNKIATRMKTPPPGAGVPAPPAPPDPGGPPDPP